MIFQTYNFPENEISDKHGLTVKQLKDNGYVFWREIDNILYAIVPMTFGKGRLLIDCNSMGYEDFYCFPTVERAVKSLIEYKGEDGPEFNDWHRHFSTGRRREDGNPSSETVYF